MVNGKFVISLDFELHWGFFDNRTLADSRAQLSNINTVVDRLLKLTNQYDVNITFATVGFLFGKDIEDVKRFLPKEKPNYKDNSLSAYDLLSNIETKDQPFYFAQSLVNKIKNEEQHEIGTHTFSHYYCYEKGQNSTDFKADIEAALAIGKELNIATKSIVFPRNQVQQDYISICKELGIETYRGNCWFNFNNDERNLKLKGYALIASRVFDSYFNLSGSNSFKLEDYNTSKAEIINIPASRFLRPYTAKLKALESFKVRRIKKAMTKAAKRNEVYHLWWHPHNFASNIEENFKNLLDIFQHYEALKERYNFESITMVELGREFKNS